MMSTGAMMTYLKFWKYIYIFDTGTQGLKPHSSLSRILLPWEIHTPQAKITFQETGDKVYMTI